MATPRSTRHTPVDPPRQPPAPPTPTVHAPESSTQGDTTRSDRLPFLKVAHLHDDRDTGAEITGPIRLFTGGHYGHQLLVTVLLDTGHSYDFALRIGGQQHVRLERLLGKNLLDWANGQLIALYRDTYKDNTYVAVRDRLPAA